MTTSASSQANARHATKVCVTGPQMLAKRATNEFYPSDKELIFDLTDILNEELQGSRRCRLYVHPDR